MVKTTQTDIRISFGLNEILKFPVLSDEKV